MNDCIDAHVHVWAPPSKQFPYDPAYVGTPTHPTEFSPNELLRMSQPTGVSRIVLVQMSCYGADNSFMLAAMKNDPTVFSGIAIVDHRSSVLESELLRLAALGIRGLRIDQGTEDDDWLISAEMQSLWSMAAKTKLAMCCLVNPRDLTKLSRMCEQFPDTRVVIDHMARIGMDGRIRDQDVHELCSLAKNAAVYVKVSAFYALGKRSHPYEDLAPMVESTFRAFGAQRLMWGSDAPFQVQSPFTYTGSLDFVEHHLPFLDTTAREWLLRKTAEGLFF
jgi:predicted TIM-barrel fold metal-dependent hydrolase